MEDASGAPRTTNKADSTAYLREKLGFGDDSEWKRFSNRRLELINVLRLDEQKASKQEPQIRQVAERVASEFGYSADAIPDFERLVRLGVQSVRRNRRRPTKTGSLATTTFELGPTIPPSTPTTINTVAAPLLSSTSSLATKLDNPLQTFADHCRDHAPSNALVSAGAIRLAIGLVMGGSQSSHAQTIVQSLENGPLGEEIARIVGIASFNQAVVNACFRDSAAAVQILVALFEELLALSDHVQMVQYIKHCEMRMRPMLWRPHSAQPTTVPGARTQTPVTAIAAVPPLPLPHQPTHATSVTTVARLPPLEGPMWADRLVTISYLDRRLNFTFSPLKGTPPTLQEIVDTCRTSFGLSDDNVLRVRTCDSGKIIDTNADLADAFLSNKLELEIFLPPKPEQALAPPLFTVGPSGLK